MMTTVFLWIMVHILHVRSSKKDIAKVQKQLTSSQVFTLTPGRQHKSFKNLKTNLIRTLKKQEVTDWILDHYYPIEFESNFKCMSYIIIIIIITMVYINIFINDQ